MSWNYLSRRARPGWAAVAFVASYASPGNRQAYSTQLRLWFDWCYRHGLEPLAEVRRPHVELYARELETRGLAPATIALKLVVITGWYRDCVEEQLLEHSPAVHVRRPKVSQDSTRLGLDRTELGSFLVQAGLSGGNDHVLACLLTLNALRISEACGADLTDLALANGHRVLRIVGKGNQPALIPLALAPRGPSTPPLGSAPTVRCWPALMAADSTGTPPDASCAGSRPRQGSTSASPHTRYAMPRSPPLSMPAAACATSRTSPATLIRVKPAATTAPAVRSTATPPTSSRPTWRERPRPIARHPSSRS
jgi:hypothetical protein